MPKVQTLCCSKAILLRRVQQGHPNNSLSHVCYSQYTWSQYDLKCADEANVRLHEVSLSKNRSYEVDNDFRRVRVLSEQPFSIIGQRRNTFVSDRLFLREYLQVCTPNPMRPCPIDSPVQNIT